MPPQQKYNHQDWTERVMLSFYFFALLQKEISCANVIVKPKLIHHICQTIRKQASRTSTFDILYPSPLIVTASHLRAIPHGDSAIHCAMKVVFRSDGKQRNKAQYCLDDFQIQLCRFSWFVMEISGLLYAGSVAAAGFSAGDGVLTPS